MITIIQEKSVVYLIGGDIFTITHRIKEAEVEVLYANGGRTTYYHVKELRFNDD